MPARLIEQRSHEAVEKRRSALAGKSVQGDSKDRSGLHLLPAAVRFEIRNKLHLRKGPRPVPKPGTVVLELENFHSV